MPKRHYQLSSNTSAETQLRDIGERIRAIRKVTGLTQPELCELLGATQTAWSRWEIGRNAPDILIMIAFAARAKVTLDLIYRGITDGSHPVLVRLLREDVPHLLASPPTGTAHNRDMALASYKNDIGSVSPRGRDHLYEAS
jgi:transcriptional regulator with XRE-family HTH domain